MKICYKVLLDLCHEIEDELANQEKSYAMDFFIEKVSYITHNDTI